MKISNEWKAIMRVPNRPLKMDAEINQRLFMLAADNIKPTGIPNYSWDP